MTWILGLLLAALMGMTVFSLVRGIAIFLKSTRDELERERDGDWSGEATDMQLKQNKMMVARVKYQAAAVLVVAIILVMAS